jgi:outer membrane lipoprotein-sorting protein
MNMRKMLWSAIAVLALHAGARAQEFVPATGEERQVMLEKIGEASRQMRSLACDFEQVKELSILDEQMVSRGWMRYRQDNRLRWEYVSPYRYTLVLNDQKMLVETEKSRNVVDVKSNKLFQEIVKIMMNSINGRGLTDVRSFSAAYYQREKEWKVALVPVQREMRRMFSVIELIFNVENFTVERVRMEEPNGDTTLITLSGKEFNGNLGDEIFVVD